MRYLLTADEMQKCDRHTWEYYGVPELVLMERAALKSFEEICKWHGLKKILIVTGSGNNGADGLAIARLLLLKGYSVDVFEAGTLEHASKSYLIQREIYSKYQGNFVFEIHNHYDMIVDAIFGVGLNRDIVGNIASIIETLNDMNGYKLAIDLPSGVNANDGSIWGIAFIADETVTFGFEKLGMCFYPGKKCCGRIVVADIGIDEHSILDVMPQFFTIDTEEEMDLPVRIPNGHKGTFGKLLIVAGNNEIAGAAILATRAAFAMGTGMVCVVTHENNRVILQQTIPEVMISTYTGHENEEQLHAILKKKIEWCDGILIGPGLGTDSISREIVDLMIDADKPMVIDADGINILASEKNLKERLKKRNCATILTPHMGELSRLSEMNIKNLVQKRFFITQKLCMDVNCTIAAKDAVTIVADETDNPIYVNQSGNEGMAVAGSGDVLAGMVATLLLQLKNPFKAAYIGVYLHGKSGDVCKEQIGSASMMPSDMIDQLKKYMKEIYETKISQD